MKTYRLVNVGGVVASILVAAGSAWAQTAPAPAPAPAPAAAAPAPAPAPAPAAEAAPAPAPAVAAPAEPAPAPAPAAAPAPPPPRAAAVAGESDHDMMVGRFALGYLGMRSMLIGAGLPASEVPVPGGQPPVVQQATVNAPIIGMRFWASQVVGIDAGIGFFTDWGSDTIDLRDPLDLGNANQAASNDVAGTTAFLVHVGVPLALAGAKHFSFQVTPEVNIGFATQSVNPNPPTLTNAAGNDVAMPKITNTGLHFDVGGRAGAELHFGFIGVPQLSLQGGIGVLLAIDNTKSSQGQFGEAKRSRGSIRTTVNDNPWNIFISNVAALYYF